MKSQNPKPFRSVITIAGVALLSLGSPAALAQQAQSQVMTTTSESPKIPNDQLDSLVAPIAVYPDPLLAQTLAASTYPLEIVQLQQWMERNKNLKGKALADSVEKQNWDPSIQAMAAFPDVVNRLADNIQWTSDLGNAFLAQQSDVMDAVQRMRAKAQGSGNLKTSAQQKVETRTVEGGKQVIVVEQANPEVVYVPSYDPMVVYGPPAYPYPPYYYPGYVAGAGLAFGAGLILGGAWANNWGDCDWGRGDVNININNNFNRNNISNRPAAGQGNKWQHRPEHRGNAPYGDRRTADKFGGGTRQQPARASGNRPGGGAGAGTRPGGGAGARPSGGAGPGARPGGGARATTRPAGGGGSRVGNRSISPGPSSSSRGGAFGGGMSGSSAGASSMRGGRSMGGGGYSRGGGGGMGGGGRRR